MQTHLVDFLFSDFKRKFATFFDPCEIGFTNELIMNMTAFKMPHQFELASPDRRMDMFYFISEGLVSFTGHKTMKPFLILPQYSTIGDFQILFNLKSMYSCKVYRHEEQEDLTLELIS